MLAADAPPHDRLRDFVASPRLAYLAAVATAIGVVGGVIALALLRLIALFTNVFFFQRVSIATSVPADAHLGPLIIVVPVLGGLIIGLMARYGSDRIRGHGIPEAIEAILINGSRMQPRVAVLKPLSSAISIGSGGPFGAEGPIIMTGGAFGSIVAQFLHLTASERKTLLVAGAAAGMSATFAAPIAAVLLAVELLLFEWRPRSLVPVALASAAAAATRHYLLGNGPLFPVPVHAPFDGVPALTSCVLVGLLAGLLSLVLTGAVYLSEDAFGRLPIHWMWWPAIGGLVIGLGGFIFPEALGVGYGNISTLLNGDATVRLVVGILLVKTAIWSISLGSGTSGGVLAPLLMIGGALGAVEGTFLPSQGPGFWPLVSMAAVLGGTMRTPLTGTIFALELTHDINMLLPVLIATIVAYGFTVVVMRRSILTEKVSRRGFHLSREYSVDPMESLFVSDVMREPTASPVGVTATTAAALANDGDAMDAPSNTVAYVGEPLTAVVYRMAETRQISMPVIDPASEEVVGVIALTDLLAARRRILDHDNHRERTLRLSVRYPAFLRRRVIEDGEL
jgi:H+/Cl- antiporter ClcA